MAGESAQREYERRRTVRQDRIRRSWLTIVALVVLAFIVGWLVSILVASAFLSVVDGVVPDGTPGFSVHAPPLLFSLSLALGFAVKSAWILMAPSRAEMAWGKGAGGERIVGTALDALPASQVRVLHDRLIPRSRANIDHVAITPTRVYPIDAKRYAGRLQVRAGGQQLWINGRNRSKLLEQGHRQADTVTAVLAEAGIDDVAVTPVLCFVETELPRLFPPTQAVGVLLTTPRKLRKLLTSDTDADVPKMVRIVDALEAALLPATQEPHTRPQTGAAELADQTPTAMSPRSDEPAASSSRRSCGRCEEPMVVRTRRSDDSRFLGCSAFPRCRNTESLQQPPTARREREVG